MKTFELQNMNGLALWGKALLLTIEDFFKFLLVRN